MKTTISISGSSSNVNSEWGEYIRTSIDVLDAAYHTAHRFPGGVPALAGRMGIVPGVLQNKVNASNTSHHLTLREAMAMQEITGDVAILNAMADALGYVCVRGTPANPENLQALHWQMVSAYADLGHSIVDATSAGAVSRNAMRRCEAMAAELSSAINAVLGSLRARMPSPPKGSEK